jgi:hypothetical protein
MEAARMTEQAPITEQWDFTPAETLASAIATTVFPHVQDLVRQDELRDLLMRFAEEIKREAVYPRQHYAPTATTDLVAILREWICYSEDFPNGGEWRVSKAINAIERLRAALEALTDCASRQDLFPVEVKAALEVLAQ